MRSNYLYMPLFISVMAVWIGSILFEAGDSDLFYISCFLLTIVTIIHAAVSVLKGKVNVPSLICTQTMLWYVVPFTYIRFVGGFAKYFVDVSEREAVSASVIVVLICAGTFVLAELRGATVRLPEFGSEGKLIAAFALPVVAVQAYLIASGQYNYASAAGIHEDGLLVPEPLYVQIVRGSAAVVAPLVAGWLGWIRALPRQERGNRFPAYLCIGACLIIEVLWFMQAGRRPMAIVGLMALTTFFSARFGGVFTRKRIAAMLLVGCLAVPAIWACWQAYYTLRLASNELGSTEDLSILDLSRAKKVAQGGSDDFDENVITRPFGTTLSFVYVAFDMKGTLHGWQLGSQILISIPSLLWENKLNYIGPTDEDLWGEYLGIQVTDYANTLLLESYVDFRWWGFAFYMIILSFAIWIVQRISLLIDSNVAPAIIYIGIVFQSLNIETSTSGLLVALRSILISFAFLAMVSALLGRRKARNYANSRGNAASGVTSSPGLDAMSMRTLAR